MQCVSSIQKFAKNRVMLRLYSRFVTYMHKKLWDLTRMHRLWVVPELVQPLATDSAMLTAVVCGAMRVAALSLWCHAFSLQDFCQYIIQPVYNIDTGYILLYNIYIYIYCIIIFYIICIWNILICFAKKNLINFYFLLYYWLCYILNSKQIFLKII